MVEHLASGQNGAKTFDTNNLTMVDPNGSDKIGGHTAALLATQILEGILQAVVTGSFSLLQHKDG